jgi:hypothetical protein
VARLPPAPHDRVKLLAKLKLARVFVWPVNLSRPDPDPVHISKSYLSILPILCSNAGASGELGCQTGGFSS